MQKAVEKIPYCLFLTERKKSDNVGYYVNKSHGTSDTDVSTCHAQIYNAEVIGNVLNWQTRSSNCTVMSSYTIDILQLALEQYKDNLSQATTRVHCVNIASNAKYQRSSAQPIWRLNQDHRKGWSIMDSPLPLEKNDGNSCYSPFQNKNNCQEVPFMYQQPSHHMSFSI